jgi:hypothetical protein
MLQSKVKTDLIPTRARRPASTKKTCIPKVLSVSSFVIHYTSSMENQFIFIYLFQ